MNLNFSIIIPVYNRPDELDELLSSISSQHFKEAFEVLVVEDGSDLTAKHIVENFKDELDINYLTKDNSGPGLSRNFGMQNAKGNYFIILDSDCILPENYLIAVSEALSNNFTDAYGGADAAHTSFTKIQKAINYAMTSVLTTGGLRGNKKNLAIAKRENAAILLYEDNYKEKYKGFDENSAESVIGLSLLQEENLDKSLALASLIQNNFARKLKRNDRKVKQDNFQVLRETIMPSVLVELGFLTNKKEGRYLNSKRGQEQMSKAIADAVLNYISNLKLNTVDVSNNIVKPVNFVEYKIQISSGKNKIATKSYNFKGLKNVQRVAVGKYYKYYYGMTSDYKSVKESLKTAKNKGFSSAFIVAFYNGEKISVSEAVKMQ